MRFLQKFIPFLKGTSLIDLENLKNYRVVFSYLRYLRPYRLIYALMCAAIVLSIIVSLVQPVLYRHLVDDVLTNVTGKSSISLLIIYVALLLLLRVLSLLAGVSKQIWDGRIVYSARTDLEKKLYRKMQQLPMRYFDHHTGGDMLPRLYSDPDIVIGALVNLIPSIVEMVLRGAFILAIIVSIVWWAGILALLPLIPITIIGLWNMRYYKALSDKIFRFQQDLYTRVLDTFEGIRIVRIFRKEYEESRRFSVLQDRLLHLQLSNNKRNAWLSPLIGTVGRTGGLIIFLVGAVAIVLHIPLGKHQEFTLGLLFMLLSYVWQLAAPISRIGRMANAYGEAIASALRLEEFFSMKDSEQKIIARKTLSEHSDLILKCVHVSFGYRKDKKVLNDVSMEIGKGEVVGLVGPSGSGKTTLVNLICGFYPVSEGQIFLKINNNADISLALQHPHIFQGTIRASITYGNPDVSEKEIWNVLSCVSADDFVRSLPNGLDTVVGSGARILSAGQEQRISLARALMNCASLMILDEATCWIDLQTERKIWRNIRRWMQGKSILFISHRMHLMPTMNRVFVLKNGMILCQGKHRELLETNPYYRNAYHGT